MKITQTQLQSLCAVSRLSLEKNETEEFLLNLNMFLSEAERVASFATQTEQLFFEGSTREDCAVNNSDSMIESAAEAEDGYYAVMRIME